MTTRRQASSPGKMQLLQGLYGDAGDSQFEDFRRRHSKQNRDIVRENANRLMMNKALQEEIVNLHRELLAVRQSAASMALKIRSLEDEMDRLRTEPARLAVDAILAAVPALQQLQTALIPAARTLCPSPIKTPVEITPWPEKPAVARQMRADLMLEALTERTEVESECGSEQDVPSPPRRTRRRESGFIRIPALSPELLDVMDTGRERVRDEEGEVEGIVMDAVEEESEAEKSEPSARRAAAVLGNSAIQVPLKMNKPTAPTRKPSVPNGRAPVKKPGEGSSRVTAKNPRSAPPVEPRASVSKDLMSSSSKTPSSAPSVPQPQSCTSKASSTIRPVTVSILAATPSPVQEETPAEDEASARSRTGRARKSVNYKEPSLHKKMRKPDSDHEAESGIIAGPSIRRKSVLPRHRISQPAALPPPLPLVDDVQRTEKASGPARVESETVRMLLGLDEAQDCQPGNAS